MRRGVRDDDEFLNEGLDDDNVFVPVDTFMRKEIGKKYSPFDEYEEEEMVIPLEF